MEGWVPAGAAAAGTDGQRVRGSPGGGLWADGVRIREDFVGDAEVTGRLANATGQNLEYPYVEVIFLGSEGIVLYVGTITFESLPDGESRAFSATSLILFDEVAEVEFQM